MKILIADIPDTQHALDVKQSISDGYGSDISNDIEIVSSSLQTTINSATEDTVMIVHSYTGVATKVNMSQEVYPNILVFMPLGSNSFTQLNLFAEQDPPVIVTCGAGDYEERNNTGYGNGLEFWDEDLIWNDGDDQSSFSNGKIAGKLLKIKDTLNCDWWTARYLARLTADRNEPNRETSLWDLRNGYGKINVQAAIEAYGSVEIPADPYLPPPPPEPLLEFEPLTASFDNGRITLTWNDLGDATYEIFHKQGELENWQSIGITTNTSFIDETLRQFADLAYYKVVATHNEMEDEKESEIILVVLPNNIQITVSHKNERIVLSWNNLGDASYEVYRKQGKFESWQSVGTTSSTSFVDDTVQRCADLTYYKVVATHNETDETKESGIIGVPFYKIDRVYCR